MEERNKKKKSFVRKNNIETLYAYDTPVSLVHGIVDLRVGINGTTNAHACKPARADIGFEHVICLLTFYVGLRHVKTHASVFGQNGPCRTPFYGSSSSRIGHPVVTVRRSQRTFRVGARQSLGRGLYKLLARPFLSGKETQNDTL